MDTTDARTVAATYFRAWKDRDFATLRAILADDVSFRGPLATLDNADDCVEGLRDAARVEARVRSASRWYPRYLAAMGVLAFALIVGTEALFPTGIARYAVIAAWALAWLVLGWWAASRDVHPQGGRRRVTLVVAVWFATYLFLLGPLVRWQAGYSPAWWVVAALVVASPFLVAARRAQRP